MTRGSTVRSAPERVPRFGGTERALHWVHAAGFTGMLATGLSLSLTSLSSLASRPTLKAVHLAVAAIWMTFLLVVTLAGDRRQLRQTRREIERFDVQDVAWLRHRPFVTSGRFNAGQKSHAVIQAALALLFVVSGVLLWAGERDHAFRLPGSIALHDVATVVAVVLVLGHLFLALVWPATRPALAGMVRGSVRADWAAEHHGGWEPAAAPSRAPRPGRGRLAVVALVLLAGAIGTVALVRSTGADGPRAVAARPTAGAQP